jgi:predicted SAM-dependent methyltransferase
VGCGPKNLMVDWWNVDIRSFKGVDEVADVTAPWPWHDLDYVYGEHFLEHLSPDQAVDFLRQARTGLRPGGRIRLSTPGLEWVWRTHFRSGETAQGVVADTYRANRAFHGWGHQFLWSEELLTGLLSSMGYEDVETFTYGESNDPVLHSIERHGKFSVNQGHPSVIIVEAVRGEREISLEQGIEAWIEAEFLSHVNAGH